MNQCRGPQALQQSQVDAGRSSQNVRLSTPVPRQQLVCAQNMKTHLYSMEWVLPMLSNAAGLA